MVEQRGSLNTDGNQPHSNTERVCVSKCLYEYYCDDNFFAVHPSVVVLRRVFSFAVKTKQTNDVRMGSNEVSECRCVCPCVCSSCY